MTRIDPPESFIRWQAILREQLTFANNLILAFSVASLGFALSLLQQRSTSFECIIWIESLAAISLATSVLIGTALVVNRLKDFRISTKIAKLREEGGNDAELAADRSLAKRLGARTWCLFWWQIGTFAAGAILMAIAVMVPILRTLLTTT